MTEEIWKPIQRFPGYEVSSLGRVRSMVVTKGRRPAGYVLSTHHAGNGYCQVRILWDGRSRVSSIHKLVMEAFVGPRPEGMQVRHLDGNKNNNTLSNLTYGTPKENGQDKVRHGTTNRGEKNVKAKLSADVVASIRQQYASGVKARVLAERHQLHPCTVHRVVKGVYWTEVGGPIGITHRKFQ